MHNPCHGNRRLIQLQPSCLQAANSIRSAAAQQHAADSSPSFAASSKWSANARVRSAPAHPAPKFHIRQSCVRAVPPAAPAVAAKSPAASFSQPPTAADRAQENSDNRAPAPCCAWSRCGLRRSYRVAISCTTRPPSSTTPICRSISYSSAARMIAKAVHIFHFRLGAEFFRAFQRTLTLASQRSEPSSMLQSLPPCTAEFPSCASDTQTLRPPTAGPAH